MNSLKRDEEVLVAFLSGVNQVDSENRFSCSFILMLCFQTFLAYLFIAIACALISEGHGPSHEVVPEVNVLTEVVFNFFSSGL